MKKIVLKTEDGVKIAGDYNEVYPAGRGEGSGAAAVLLHMMPVARGSWKPFTQHLTKAGFSSVAIDFRGHGESKDGPDGYKKFFDEDHQKSILDVKIAVDFLAEKGVARDKIFLAGASIGANLALRYQSEHAEIKASVLLSPGLDYHGIKTEPFIKKLKNDQAVYIAGSKNDCGYKKDKCADEMAEKLFQEAQVKNKKLKIFDNSAHGTTILLRNAGFSEEIIEWLKELI